MKYCIMENPNCPGVYRVQYKGWLFWHWIRNYKFFGGPLEIVELSSHDGAAQYIEFLDMDEKHRLALKTEWQESKP